MFYFKTEPLNEYQIVQNCSQRPGVDIQRKDIRLEFDDVESFSNQFHFKTDGLEQLLHNQYKKLSTSSPDRNNSTLPGMRKNSKKLIGQNFIHVHFLAIQESVRFKLKLRLQSVTKPSRKFRRKAIINVQKKMNWNVTFVTCKNSNTGHLISLQYVDREYVSNQLMR